MLNTDPPSSHHNTAALNTAVFSPDGGSVLTASNDGTARLWDTDYHDTIRYLCGQLLRDFTADARVRYEIQGTTPTCPAQ